MLEELGDTLNNIVEYINYDNLLHLRFSSMHCTDTLKIINRELEKKLDNYLINVIYSIEEYIRFTRNTSPNNMAGVFEVDRKITIINKYNKNISKNQVILKKYNKLVENFLKSSINMKDVSYNRVEMEYLLGNLLQFNKKLLFDSNKDLLKYWLDVNHLERF